MVFGQLQRRVSNERGSFIHYERWTIEGQGWDFKAKKKPSINNIYFTIMTIFLFILIF